LLIGRQGHAGADLLIHVGVGCQRARQQARASVDLTSHRNKGFERITGWKTCRRYGGARPRGVGRLFLRRTITAPAAKKAVAKKKITPRKAQ
jgi:hypothetical protein